MPEFAHVILTCKNHPSLRWCTKGLAWRSDFNAEGTGYFRGTRGLFFFGMRASEAHSPYKNVSWSELIYDPTTGEALEVVKECDCDCNDLIESPEFIIERMEAQAKEAARATT